MIAGNIFARRLGLILSIVCLALGVKGIVTIRPASDYEDMGVHTFFLYKVLPHTVENHATGQDKRNNPTKTMYVVYYQTSDGTGYQWKLESSNDKDYANQILAEGESVDRCVLSIKENRKYMTVDAELTADTYAAGQQKRYDDTEIFIFKAGVDIKQSVSNGIKKEDLLIDPEIVGKEYWTRGYFFNIAHITISVNNYGFYSIGKRKFFDEFGNDIHEEPYLLGTYGVATISGIAYGINKEMIISGIKK